MTSGGSKPSYRTLALMAATIAAGLVKIRRPIAPHRRLTDGAYDDQTHDIATEAMDIAVALLDKVDDFFGMVGE